MKEPQNRIVFVMSRITRGGTERACLNTAIACLEAGMEAYLAVKEGSSEISYDVPSSIKVVSYGEDKEGKQYSAIARAMNLRHVLNSLSPNCVVSFNQRYTDLLLSGCLLRYKVVASERFYPKKHYERRLLARFISWLTYVLSTTVVFQTPENMRCYGKRIRDKSVVIPNAIAPGLPNYTWDEDYRAIVTACRLEPQKNPELLVRAFALLREQCSKPYMLRIFGSGSLEGRLRELAEELRIEDVVEIMPFRANVHQAMLDAAMFVSSSDFEGIQNSLLEAMGMGIPCVATDCLGGGAKLLIGEHNERGLLVPRGDVQALADAMKRLACDESLSHRYSMAGRELSDKYSVDAISAQWVGLFR